MNFRFYLLTLILLDVTTAIFARYSFITNSNIFIFFSILSLTTAGYIFMKTLNFKQTAIVNAIWIALGSILVSITSYILFDEALTIIQIAGMAIIIIGLIIMEISPKKIIEN